MNPDFRLPALPITQLVPPEKKQYSPKVQWKANSVVSQAKATFKTQHARPVKATNTDRDILAKRLKDYSMCDALTFPLRISEILQQIFIITGGFDTKNLPGFWKKRFVQFGPLVYPRHINPISIKKQVSQDDVNRLHTSFPNINVHKHLKSYFKVVG